MVTNSIFFKKNFAIVFSLITIIIVITTSFSRAATITSLATGGNWNTITTWDLNRVPIANDDVIISAGSIVTVNINTASMISLTIDGSLNVGAYNITVLGDMFVNNGAAINFTSITGSKTFGNININNGGTWDNGGLAVTIICKGDWNNSGTFNAGISKVNFTFPVAETHSISGNDPVFYNMTLTSGTLDASYLTTLSISNLFTLTAGNFYASDMLNLNNLQITSGIFYAASSINVSGDWSNNKNAAAFDPGYSIVNFTGTAMQKIAGTATAQTFYDIVLNNSAILTIPDALTLNVLDNFTLTAGTLEAGNSTINIGYQWINNGATFNYGTGTIRFNGEWYTYVTGTVTDQTFYNLTIANAVGWPLMASIDQANITSITVNGNFLLTSGGCWAPPVMTVKGNFTLISDGFMADANLYVGGNWINNGDGSTRGSFDTYDCSCDALVTFNGSGAQSISGTANMVQEFSSITIDKSAGSMTLSNSTPLVLWGQLSLSNGAFTAGTNKVTLNGNIFQTNGTISSTGTVIYNAEDYWSLQNVAIGNYKNLTFSDYNKFLFAGNINISGVFTAGTATGHYTTGNTISFTSATSQNIPSFNYPNDIGIDGYNNLSFFNSSKALSGNIGVRGVLSFPSGTNITLGANNLIIGDSGSIAGTPNANHMILVNSTGRLIKKFTTGAQSFLYPVGIGTTYTPLSLAFNNVTIAGSVGVTVVAKVDPNGSAPPIFAGEWLKRYWAMDNDGSDFAFDYYSANVNYIAADLPASFTIANMAGRIWDGSVWYDYFISNRTALSPTVVKIKTLGELTFSKCIALSKFSDPKPALACNGLSPANATFSVATEGTVLSYQWRENGVSLGADNSIYVGTQTSDLTIINPPAGLNNKTYDCIVTASASCSGTFTSNAATLTINGMPPTPPTLSITPSSTICEGTAISLTCNTSETLPVKYEWLDLTSTWDTYPDTSKTLTLSDIHKPYTEDRGRGPGVSWILCCVSNMCGTRPMEGCADIFVTVMPAPAISSTTTTEPSTCTGNDGKILLNGLLPSTEYTLTYEKDSLSQGGSKITSDIAGVVTIPNLTAGTYSKIILTLNSCSSDTAGPVTLSNIIKLSDPEAYIICGDTGTATFSVSVQGSPLSFQWRENGISLEADNGIYSGTQTAKLTITNPAANFNNNTYDCIVTANCKGSFTSSPATLTVGGSIPANLTLTATPLTPFHEGDNVIIKANIDNPDIPTTFTWWLISGTIVVDPTSGNTLTLNNVPYNGDGIRGPGVTWILTSAKNVCGSSTNVFYPLNIVPKTSSTNPTSCGGNDGIILFPGLIPKSEYDITYSKDYIAQTPLVLFADDNGLLTISNLKEGKYTDIVLYLNRGCGGCTTNSASADTISLFFQSAGTPVFSSGAASLCKGNTEKYTATATNSTAISYSIIDGNATVNPVTGEVSGVSANFTIRATASGECGSPTTSDLKVSVLNPVESSHEIINKIKCQEDSTLFKSVATGDNIRYQWYKDDSPVTDATLSTYQISNIKKKDEGFYKCKVYNICSSDSSLYSLIMRDGPGISMIEMIQKQCITDSVNYNLSPSGTPPFSFQWMKNGNDILNQTNNTYFINSLILSDSGKYSCRITNQCLSIVASVSSLSVSNCGRGNLDGTLTYDNLPNTALPYHTIYLTSIENNTKDSTTTNDKGYYQFINLHKGNYQITVGNNQGTLIPWGGADPLDALWVNKSYIGQYTISDSLKTVAANVDNGSNIDPGDALIINRRYIGMLDFFAIPDWIFETAGITINGSNVTYNLKAVCAGDVDGSNFTTK